MRKSTRRILIALGCLLVALVLIPAAIWFSLKHEPTFYRELVDKPIVDAEEVAKRFEQDSLQLRNDIVNEPTWEGVFSDQEVNAWLAEGLMKHFAEDIPRGIRDPRVLFENDRITVAFKLEQQGVTSVISVVLQVSVPEDNVVQVAVEKVRAGALPVPTDRFIEPLKQRAKDQGLELTWTEVGGVPVARVAYQTERNRKDVILERVQVIRGQIKLSGRSTREAGPVAGPKLPDGRTLQRQLPKRKTQEGEETSEVVRSEALPVR